MCLKMYVWPLSSQRSGLCWLLSLSSKHTFMFSVMLALSKLYVTLSTFCPIKFYHRVSQETGEKKEDGERAYFFLFICCSFLSFSSNNPLTRQWEIFLVIVVSAYHFFQYFWLAPKNTIFFSRLSPSFMMPLLRASEVLAPTGECPVFRKMCYNFANFLLQFSSFSPSFLAKSCFRQL